MNEKNEVRFDASFRRVGDRRQRKKEVHEQSILKRRKQDVSKVQDR